METRFYNYTRLEGSDLKKYLAPLLSPPVSCVLVKPVPRGMMHLLTCWRDEKEGAACNIQRPIGWGPGALAVYVSWSESSFWEKLTSEGKERLTSVEFNVALLDELLSKLDCLFPPEARSRRLAESGLPDRQDARILAEWARQHPIRINRRKDKARPSREDKMISWLSCPRVTASPSESAHPVAFSSRVAKKTEAALWAVNILCRRKLRCAQEAGTQDSFYVRPQELPDWLRGLAQEIKRLRLDPEFDDGEGSELKAATQAIWRST